MRPNAGTFAVIFLISTAVVTGASAQQRHLGGGGGGGGGGGFSMPHGGGGGGGGGFSMPRGGGGGGFSAAPRMSAPQVSAPRFSAPTPHIATAPRNTAPHTTSRSFTASHTTTRHMATSRPSITARHVTPQKPKGSSVIARHNVTPQSSQKNAPVTSNAKTSPTTRTSTTKTSTTKQANLPTAATNRPGSTATSNAQKFTNAQKLTLNTPQTKNLQMHYTGGSPVLRNTTLASLSSRDPTTRSLTQSTFRGNFAQSNWGKDWGWRHHHNHFFFGFVLGFVGPVFWPYAYDDCIDYIFWPYAYDTFWPYAYDDVFSGIYGAYAPQYYAPEDVYAYAGAPASRAVYSSATGVSRPSAALPGGSQICSGQAQGLTDFPIERIAQQVSLDQQQQALLDNLKAATAQAVGILQASCPNELPSTPTARLIAMRSRVEAMLQAVQAVRSALDAFYSSLSDEQKERFNALDGDINAAGREVDVGGLCNRSTARTQGLPVARIERSLQLNVRQDTALKDLNDASGQAAEILKGGCQQAQMLTPTGRLAAMEDRFNSMLQALQTVQPALAKFYNSLSDEQKARFDRLNARPA
jgi:hypothetical protein